MAGGSVAALGGYRVGGPGQHENESQDTEDDQLLGHPDDEQNESDHDADSTEKQAAPGAGASGRTAHGRGELGVLGIQRPLHLFEQALLVFGERHVDLLQVHSA